MQQIKHMDILNQEHKIAVDEQLHVTEQLEELIKQLPDETREKAKMEIFRALMDNVDYLRTIPRRYQRGYMLDIFQQMDRQVAENAAKYKTTCKKGCSFCCKIEVRITDMEAEMLMEHTLKNDGPFSPSEMAMLERQSKIPADEYTVDKDRNCVFLSDEGECTVYEARPLACRSYMVVSPAEHCNALLNKKKEVQAVASILTEIMRSALISGRPHGRMSNMLLQIIKEKEVKDGNNS